MREICNNIDHLKTADMLVADNAARRLHGEIAAKNSKPPQNDLFDLRQELVAPIHRRAQGLLAWQGGAPTAGQQVEPVGQPLSKSLNAERVYLDRGEFQSQGHAVETTANFQHVGNVG